MARYCFYCIYENKIDKYESSSFGNEAGNENATINLANAETIINFELAYGFALF